MVLDLVNVGSGAIWLGQINNEYLLLGQWYVNVQDVLALVREIHI